MCGRYTLTATPDTLYKEFGVKVDDLAPSYNVAPTREVPAVVADGGSRKLEMLRWGLVPSWAKDPAIGQRMINARSETVAEKPSYRSAFRRRRCLILADGFYEWKKEDDGKQPFYIRLEGGEPFAFAGLWESWDDGGTSLRTCTILTTGASDDMRPVHHRMPVILPAATRDDWLNPELEGEELLSLLKPYDGELEMRAVSRHVNRPTNDDPGCIEPLEAAS